MYNLILYFIMNSFFIGYVLFILFKYGIQTSISQSYYNLPNNWQWLYTISMWGYALPALIIGVPYSGLMFLAGSAICFVGASPAFRNKGIEHTVHMVGAIIGIVSSQLFISIVANQWYITLAFILFSVIAYLIPKNRDYIEWWLEIFAFISVDLCYFLLPIF